MRLIRAILIAVISAVVAATVSYVLFVRPRVRSWGFDPQEAELPIPGDDLIAEPSASETRGITIEAPVAKVWPWLVQMGFGRGGWYSYEVLDSKGKSADTVLPEFQSLQAGDIMHIDPISGFQVKTVEPERALVLYTDTELARSQAEKAAAKATDDQQAPGSRMSGMMSGSSYPEFAATWSFYLRPTDDGKTRLIERLRIKTPGNGAATPVLGEIMGTGIVLLTRKQMLGIKERVEREHLGIGEQAESAIAAESAETPEGLAWPEQETEPSLATNS